MPSLNNLKKTSKWLQCTRPARCRWRAKTRRCSQNRATTQRQRCGGRRWTSLRQNKSQQIISHTLSLCFFTKLRCHGISQNQFPRSGNLWASVPFRQQAFVARSPSPESPKKGRKDFSLHDSNPDIAIQKQQEIGVFSRPSQGRCGSSQ